MKCRVDKINEFLNSEKFDTDIKDFVLKLITKLCKDQSPDIDQSKIVFLCLGFYELEKDDYIEDDSYVIDFYRLSSFNINLRAIIFDMILNPDDTGNFFEDFITDLKIFVIYQDWNKIDRKNKLISLSK